MNIGFVFTNFNNSTYTREAVKSLEQSRFSEHYSIVIVDNHSRPDDVGSLQKIEVDYPRIQVIYNQENIGYFKGLNLGIRQLRNSIPQLDCIVVGNNDLVFPEDFFQQVVLCRDNLLRYAVVSPDLITLEGVHQNPHVRARISAFRELVWDLYYSNYLVAQLIKWGANATRALSERKDYTSHQQGGVIYQGYGACYLLTSLFFEYFEELWAPSFLMGEEYFLWKQLSDKGQKLFYEPRICVQHHDHATTSEVPGRKLWEMYRESHLLYKKYRS